MVSTAGGTCHASVALGAWGALEPGLAVESRESRRMERHRSADIACCYIADVVAFKRLWRGTDIVVVRWQGTASVLGVAAHVSCVRHLRRAYVLSGVERSGLRRVASARSGAHPHLLLLLLLLLLLHLLLLQLAAMLLLIMVLLLRGR